jgi:hypothetical protein
MEVLVNADDSRFGRQKMHTLSRLERLVVHDKYVAWPIEIRYDLADRFAAVHIRTRRCASMIEKPHRQGLVVGKFCPLHRGHITNMDAVQHAPFETLTLRGEPDGLAIEDETVGLRGTYRKQ